MALPGPGGEVIGASFSGPTTTCVVTAERPRREALGLGAGARARRTSRHEDMRAEFSPDGSWIVIAGKTRLEAVRCYACAQLEDLEQRGRSLLPPS